MYDRFTIKSFFSLTLSIVLNLSDYGSDIAVAVLLSKEENTDWWFALTLMLILVPLILVNLFSIFWFHQVNNVILTSGRILTAPFLGSE